MVTQLIKMPVAGVFLATGVLTGFAAMAQTKVTGFAEPTPPAGVWFKNDVRPNGTASVVDDAVSAGSPLPTGAAKVTTDFDNASKAEIGVGNAYGLATEIFPSLNLSYSFYKSTNAGQNLFAAPSIKIALFAPLASCDSGVDPARDCFGTLTYEPYWNAGSGPIADCSTPIAAPPLDTWTDVTNIDATHGCFWWSGGFGQPNGAGGPPLKTLSAWATDFNANFGAAEVVLVSVGVGTYNQGQIGYFDDVEISHNFDGGFSRVYDFEVAPEYSCSGFDNPVGDRTIKVKKNRAIPFKANVFDMDNVEIAGLDVAAPPVISVSFLSVETGAVPEDVTNDALSAGQGSDGNAFTYNGTQWQHNLSTKNYSEPGTYTVTMVSGDASEYNIVPTCTGTFVIE